MPLTLGPTLTAPTNSSLARDCRGEPMCSPAAIVNGIDANIWKREKFSIGEGINI